MKIYARAYCLGPESDPEAVKRELSAANPGAVVQTVKESAASNEFFVEMLSAQTLRAESTGGLLAKRPEIDLLLRIAGTNQISRAIREKGAKGGEPFLVMTAGRSAQNLPRGFAGKELMRRELNRAELSRIEKAALLGTRRA